MTTESSSNGSSMLPDFLEFELAPQLSPEVKEFWKNGCNAMNLVKDPEVKLNAFNLQLFEETWDTSPDVLYPSPLRDMKYRALPLIKSEARVFFCDELIQLPKLLEIHENTTLTAEEADLVQRVIRDWAKLMNLAELDIRYQAFYDNSNSESEPHQATIDPMISTIQSEETSIYMTTNDQFNIDEDDGWTVVQRK